MPNRKHILLIEDDPAVASSLQQGLADEGYLVSWQNTGTKGVSFAGQQGPHLIILDVRWLGNTEVRVSSHPELIMKATG